MINFSNRMSRLALTQWLEQWPSLPRDSQARLGQEAFVYFAQYLEETHHSLLPAWHTLYLIQDEAKRNPQVWVHAPFLLHLLVRNSEGMGETIYPLPHDRSPTPNYRQWWDQYHPMLYTGKSQSLLPNPFEIWNTDFVLNLQEVLPQLQRQQEKYLEGLPLQITESIAITNRSEISKNIEYMDGKTSPYSDSSSSDFFSFYSLLPQENKPILIRYTPQRVGFMVKKFYLGEKQILAFFKSRENLFSPIQNSASELTPKQRDFLNYISDHPVSLHHTPLIIQPIDLDKISFLASQPFSFLTGGPGTGKTTLIASFLRYLIRVEGCLLADIGIGTPTALAAQRVKDSIEKQIQSIPQPSEQELELQQLPIQTLHHWLKWNPFTSLQHYGETLSLKYFIVDESSMLDLWVFEKLLKLFSPHTKLILVGDPNQLPPVNTKGIFNLLLHRYPQYRLQLTNTYRSHDFILNIANNLLQGTPPTLSEVSANPLPNFSNNYQEPCLLYTNPTKSPKGWDHFMYQWIFQKLENKFSAQELYSPPSHVVKSTLDFSEATIQRYFEFWSNQQILCALRKSYWGCDALNQRIHHQLFPKTFDTHFNAPIILRSNSEEFNLYNGQRGLWMKTPQSSKVYFQEGSVLRNFSASLLPAFDLAYAMTIHQSQGNEFQEILVVLGDEPHVLLTKELLYTAITRAKSFVGILGSREQIEAVAYQVKGDEELFFF